MRHARLARKTITIYGNGNNKTDRKVSLNMAIDFKKGANLLKSAADKVGEAGKNVANAAKDGVQSLSDKAHELSSQAKVKQLEELLRKFPPVSREEFANSTFAMPQLIQIIDNALRQEISEYRGVLGWSEKEDSVDILHLYHAYVPDSHIRFLPSATCGSVYCAHPFDEQCYISLDNYFSYIQQAKLAELQHIAFSLGVKHYWVELMETASQSDNSKNAVSLSGLKVAKGNAERTTQSSAYLQSKSLAEMSFSEGRDPQPPELHYFAQDENIKKLIEMRCSADKKSALTSYTIELNNSSSAAMSASTAAKISIAANKMGAGGTFQAQSAREQNSKMVFKLEF